MKSLRSTLLGFLAVAAFGFAPSASAAPVLIDFSNLVAGPVDGIDTLTGYYWNTLPVSANGTYSYALKDSTATATSLNLAFTTNISAGSNPSGATDSTLFSAWVSQDAMFMGSNGTITMTLSGLTAGQNYNFVFYGSRGSTASPVSDNRTTAYSVTSGSSTSSAELNTSNNVNNTVTINMTADLSGVATLTMTTGTGNTVGFSYLNSLQVVAVPEPGTIALALLGGGLLLVTVLRKRPAAI